MQHLTAALLSVGFVARLINPIRKSIADRTNNLAKGDKYTPHMPGANKYGVAYRSPHNATSAAHYECSRSGATESLLPRCRSAVTKKRSRQDSRPLASSGIGRMETPDKAPPSTPKRTTLVSLITKNKTTVQTNISISVTLGRLTFWPWLVISSYRDSRWIIFMVT